MLHEERLILYHNPFKNVMIFNQRQAVRLSTIESVTTEMLAQLTLHDLGFKYDQ